jgi:hypothetical protein
MVLVVLVYGGVSTHDPGTTISLIYHGVNRYAFARPIYTWRHWRIKLFWSVKHPYRYLDGGSWWGSILLLGPLGIAVWGAFADRASRRISNRRRALDDART